MINSWKIFIHFHVSYFSIILIFGVLEFFDQKTVKTFFVKIKKKTEQNQYYT